MAFDQFFPVFTVSCTVYIIGKAQVLCALDSGSIANDSCSIASDTTSIATGPNLDFLSRFAHVTIYRSRYATRLRSVVDTSQSCSASSLLQYKGRSIRGITTEAQERAHMVYGPPPGQTQGWPPRPAPHRRERRFEVRGPVPGAASGSGGGDGWEPSGRAGSSEPEAE